MTLGFRVHRPSRVWYEIIDGERYVFCSDKKKGEDE